MLLPYCGNDIFFSQTVYYIQVLDSYFFLIYNNYTLCRPGSDTSVVIFSFIEIFEKCNSIISAIAIYYRVLHAFRRWIETRRFSFLLST